MEQILYHLFCKKHLVFRNLLSLWHHQTDHHPTDDEQALDRIHRLRIVLFFYFMFSEVHQRSGTITLPFPFMASRQEPLMMVGGR